MGIYATFGISLRKYLSFGSALHVQSKSTQLFCYFEGPSKFIDQAAEFKVKTRSRFEPLLHIWPSLVKDITELEGNRRFWLQKLWFKLFEQRSNTASAGWTGKHKHRAFPSQWQTGSLCWPPQVHSRKKCCHSCNTDSVWESKRSWFWELCQTTIVCLTFIWKWNFYGLCAKMSQNNAESFSTWDQYTKPQARVDLMKITECALQLESEQTSCFWAGDLTVINPDLVSDRNIEPSAAAAWPCCMTRSLSGVWQLSVTDHRVGNHKFPELSKILKKWSLSSSIF